MTDTNERVTPKHAAGCSPPVRRGRLLGRALAAALLVLVVACVEVMLIKQAVSAGTSSASGTRDRIVRIVDHSLVSGLAPIAILPWSNSKLKQRKAS
jgi:ferric-dicitrate binding protein FerR (iron transport regulator)